MSLSALGDVIFALASKTSHIPYRNSKLTHMLQSSLGGDCKTLMFVQTSPSAADLGETLCSLNFATRVRGVEHGPARKQADLTELFKYKQLAEKAKHDDKETKKLQDSVQSLQLRLAAREHICRSLQEKVRDLENQLAEERKARQKQEIRALAAVSAHPSALSSIKEVQNTKAEKKSPLAPAKLRMPLRRISNFMLPSPVPAHKTRTSFLPVSRDDKENSLRTSMASTKGMTLLKPRRGSIAIRPPQATNQATIQPKRRASIATFHPESSSNMTTPLNTARLRNDCVMGRQSFVFGRRPPRSLLLLFFICVLVLIALLGSSSSSDFDPVTSNTRLDIYSNYRRLKEQAASDYLDLRSLSVGANRLKEFSLCDKERENFVPCYNVSGNLLAGFKDGEEFDRHCDVSRERQHCLVRPPKDYKAPLSWPAGRDIIWSANVKITKDQFLSSGSMTKRLMLLEENQIAFHSDDGLIFDGVKDYSRQIAEMIGLASDSEFRQAGVRTILDIGCGFGSFGAHLLSLKLMAVCMAAYELTGSQVQLSLERGLPAIIGNFISKQLPFPSLSYDMVHCAQCGILWDSKDGMFLIEADRLLKPGGYFVLTSPASRVQGNLMRPIEVFTQKLCWSLLAQQEETFIWQKTEDAQCYNRKWCLLVRRILLQI